MLNSIKTTLASAPGRIYNKAAETVSSAKTKVGEFHNRVIVPKMNDAKAQLDSLKGQLSSKYSQLWPRFSKNESRTQNFNSTVGSHEEEVSPQVEDQRPPTQPKNFNCTVRSFETDVEALRSRFESKTLSTQEMYEKLTNLTASEVKDAKQLGSVLNLMDDVLKSDASVHDLEKLQNAIKDSPLKADAYTLNHVKDYFRDQTKGFSGLEPGIQDALINGLSQKRTHQPL